MKTLKFDSRLVPAIMSGEKTATWRLFDDKDLTAGDEVSFLDAATGREFARAALTAVGEKKLEEIGEGDFEGHERYESPEAMYESFRHMYGDRVGPETPVKLVSFRLIQ